MKYHWEKLMLLVYYDDDGIHTGELYTNIGLTKAKMVWLTEQSVFEKFSWSGKLL